MDFMVWKIVKLQYIYNDYVQSCRSELLPDALVSPKSVQDDPPTLQEYCSEPTLCHSSYATQKEDIYTIYIPQFYFLQACRPFVKNRYIYIYFSAVNIYIYIYGRYISAAGENFQHSGLNILDFSVKIAIWDCRMTIKHAKFRACGAGCIYD